MYYHSFETGQHENKGISLGLTRLKKLDNSVTYPYLLDLFSDFYSNQISSEQVTASLGIIESYIVRRFICDVATNAMNKIFMTLSKDRSRLERAIC